MIIIVGFVVKLASDTREHNVKLAETPEAPIAVMRGYTSVLAYMIWSRFVCDNEILQP